MQAGSCAILSAIPSCRPRDPLVIAAHVWPGYELMFVARSEKWLPLEGLSLLETPSATGSLDALRSGRAQGAALTLDEVLRLRAEGLALTVVLVFDISAGADALVVRSEIPTLGALAGRRIGAETSALGGLMLSKVLEAARLPPGAVEIVPVTMENHLKVWNERRVDALITYEPIASQLVAAGGERLFDSRQLPDMIFDVLAVRSEVARAHLGTLRALTSAHFRGLEHLRANPHDAAFRLAGRMRLTGHEALAAYRGLKLPDRATNSGLLRGTGEGSLTGAARQLADVMRQGGLLAGAVDFSGLASADYLGDAVEP